MLQRVRLASVEDLLQMIQIYHKVIKDEWDECDLELLEQQHMMNPENLKKMEAITLVVEVESVGIVGWIVVHHDQKKPLSLGVGEISIYVAPEYRGNGIGTLLLNQLLLSSKKERYHKLIAIVLEDDIVGLKLYKSGGFRKVGELLNHCKINGSYKTVIVLEKILM